MKDTNTVTIAVLAAALVGVVGYLVYSAQRAKTAPGSDLSIPSGTVGGYEPQITIIEPVPDVNDPSYQTDWDSVRPWGSGIDNDKFR